MPETDLYQPVKRYLEGQGYEVKAEVRGCDVVAVRGGEPPVIVELKTAITLPLLIQAVDRQTITDAVYMATAAPNGGAKTSLWRRHRGGLLKLCRRLGLGLMTVDTARRADPFVEVHLDPQPYRPRKDGRRKAALLKEFSRRVGDPNEGGSTRRPIVTAYRQDALRCVKFLDASGEAALADIRAHTKVERAAGILQRDVYGWFERVERGVYGLTPKGCAAVEAYAYALDGMNGVCVTD